MATVIDFPMSVTVPMSDVDMAWASGYCIAKYEAARTLNPLSEATQRWREAATGFVSATGLTIPTTPMHLRRLFVEAMNEERLA